MLRGQIHINLPPVHPIMFFETIEIKMAAVSAKRSISRSRPQNLFLPTNINSIVLLFPGVLTQLQRVYKVNIQNLPIKTEALTKPTDFAQLSLSIYWSKLLWHRQQSPPICFKLNLVLVYFQLSDGRSFQAKVRFDTDVELLYFKHGGILNYMIRSMLQWYGRWHNAMQIAIEEKHGSDDACAYKLFIFLRGRSVKINEWNCRQ